MDATTTAPMFTINAVVAAGTVADEALSRVVIGAQPYEAAWDVFINYGWSEARWTENGKRMAFVLRAAR